jgi:putative ABC transport system ATP-binding protein
MAVLEAFDLYRFFHTPESETLALCGVSLRLNEGELVALIGPSGSGKSTLLACLSSLDAPDGGHVELLGELRSLRVRT